MFIMQVLFDRARRVRVVDAFIYSQDRDPRRGLRPIPPEDPSAHQGTAGTAVCSQLWL